MKETEKQKERHFNLRINKRQIFEPGMLTLPYNTYLHTKLPFRATFLIYQWFDFKKK